MLETHLRQVAATVLEGAIRIAPPDTRDWGQAMRTELNQVEGHWAALWWALGGTGVLAKQALAYIFIPSRRQGAPFGGDLFAKNVSLHKAALVSGGVYVLAALIFFAAPPFRQGLQVSMAGWNSMFHVAGWNGQPRLKALAARAEKRHDPEGLVFAAVRLWDARESARLVNEAVRLDPKLLWAYAVVAVRHSDLPEVKQWVPKLERWDPQNALFPLITAESIDINYTIKESGSPLTEFEDGLKADPNRQKALAAAFASPKLDDYLDRLRELDGRVVRRYGFSDPYAVLLGEDRGLPSYAFADCHQFAKSLVRSGENLEAQGNNKDAAKEFWAVARFGQVMDSQAHPGYDQLGGIALQAMAYGQLQALSAKEGNTGEAALFAYLGRKFDPATVAHGTLRGSIFGLDIFKRNAAVLQISSLMMMVFSGLLIVAASVLIARGRRRDSSLPPGPGVTILALTSAVGLLLSSATLYLTYRPYWYMFQDAIQKGETSHSGDLRTFLMATQVLPGLNPSSDLMHELPVYFWTGVTLLGVFGLIFILKRHLLGHPSGVGLQHSPRVP